MAQTDKSKVAQQLEDKLKALAPSQMSISSVSQWILFHNKKIDEVADEIFSSMCGNSSPEKMVTFFYLINDVVQNGKRKHPHVMTRLEKLVQQAVDLLVDGCPDEQSAKLSSSGQGMWKGLQPHLGAQHGKALGSIRRVLQILDERKIFPSNMLKTQLLPKLGKLDQSHLQASSNRQERPKSPQTPPGLPPSGDLSTSAVPSAVDPKLAEAFDDVRAAKEVCMEYGERVQQLYASTAANPNVLAQQAPLLERISVEYRNHLQSLITKRLSLVEALNSVVESEEAEIQSVSTIVEGTNNSIDKLREMMQSSPRQSTGDLQQQDPKRRRTGDPRLNS